MKNDEPSSSSEEFRREVVLKTVMTIFLKKISALAALCIVALSLGCGTTKWSDTSRTATEQLLISSAMTDVIDEFNFYPLSGRAVYIKSGGVAITDKEYLLTLLRQQLSANGVFVQEQIEEADYILEVATGAVGTNRYELMYGVPETSVPAILTLGAGTSIPEIPFVKRTDQKAQIKLTMWAYNKKTGAIIWQSGEKMKTASIRDRWIFGAGPITKSSFNAKTQVGGDDVDVPFDDIFGERVAKDEKPSVKTEAVYRELDHEAIDRLEEIRREGLLALSHELPSPDSEQKNQTAVAVDENQKPKPNTDENNLAEKNAADGKKLACDTLSDQTAEPVKTAQKPAENTPPVPPQNSQIAPSASETAAVENVSSPTAEQASTAAVPTDTVAPTVVRSTKKLDFGTVQLPLGQTYVPKK